jgi:hypothetical protein
LTGHQSYFIDASNSTDWTFAKSSFSLPPNRFARCTRKLFWMGSVIFFANLSVSVSSRPGRRFRPDTTAVSVSPRFCSSPVEEPGALVREHLSLSRISFLRRHYSAGIALVGRAGFPTAQEADDRHWNGSFQPAPFPEYPRNEK